MVGNEWQLPHPDTLLSILYILLIALALLSIVWLSFIIMGKCSEMIAKIAEMACRASGVVFIIAITLIFAISLYGYKNLGAQGLNSLSTVFTSIYIPLPLFISSHTESQNPQEIKGKQTQEQVSKNPTYGEIVMSYATEPVAPIYATLKDSLYILWSLFTTDENTINPVSDNHG